MNILFGAAVMNRIHVISKQGVKLDDELTQYRPLPLNEIEQYLAG